MMLFIVLHMNSVDNLPGFPGNRTFTFVQSG
jgi:hypothetical protein